MLFTLSSAAYKQAIKMKTRFVFIARLVTRMPRRALLACVLSAWHPLASSDPNGLVTVVLETQKGRLELELDLERAPRAARYLLVYVDRGLYDGATLYRSASLDGSAVPQLIQGGLLAKALTAEGPINPANYGVTTMLTQWETTGESGLRHQKGSVSLARDLINTGQVIPELVFCLREVPSMDASPNGRPDDKGFPVIGRVTSNFKLLNSVSSEALEGATNIEFLQGQILSAPVIITRAYRGASPANKKQQPEISNRP